MKKVLVISSSFRKNGNSDTLADEFIRGAIDSGNIVEKVYLYGKRIEFCTGCLVCQSTQECVISDDANEIIKKMICSDVIVFATPIYYYEMSGQMKTILDRSNPLYPSEYSFRNIYLIAASADGNPATIDGAVKGLESWVRCFEKTKLCGVIRGFGFYEFGAVQNDLDVLHEAYNMGKAV